MTYILVTNDDGYDAPGIFALTQAMKTLGDVRISAPATNQSASGHKKTLYTDISIREDKLQDGTPVLAVGGSPADCVAVSSLGLVPWPPRIVVSGINRGANMGQDLTYSGTVTAALEATIHGVPAIAISLDHHEANDAQEYAKAAEIAIMMVKHVLEKGLPPFTILNVNVPKGDVKDIYLTKQGIRIYHDELIQDEEKSVVQIAGEPPTGMLDDEGTDLWAVHRGYASVTPVHLDMTAHQFMANLASWNIKL